jgi:hypothetical protein
MGNPSNANQPGHVTALKGRESTFNNVYNDKHGVENPNPNYLTPTHTLYNTQEPELSADELFELAELKSMYEKWGCELHGHEEDINEVYNINRPMHNNNGMTLYPPNYPDCTSNPPPLPTPSLYTNLDALRCDFHNGIPGAIAYMQDLQEYTEECLYEHSEWKADERAEIRSNHNITYPK